MRSKEPRQASSRSAAALMLRLRAEPWRELASNNRWYFGLCPFAPETVHRTVSKTALPQILQIHPHRILHPAKAVSAEFGAAEPAGDDDDVAL